MFVFCYYSTCIISQMFSFISHHHPVHATLCLIHFINKSSYWDFLTDYWILHILTLLASIPLVSFIILSHSLIQLRAALLMDFLRILCILYFVEHFYGCSVEFSKNFFYFTGIGVHCCRNANLLKNQIGLVFHAFCCCFCCYTFTTGSGSIPLGSKETQRL